MFSETFCLLLDSNSKVRPVDGSIMLLIGDARCPPDFEDEETAMARDTVTFPSHTVNLWHLQNRNWAPCPSPTLSPCPEGGSCSSPPGGALRLPQVGASWLLWRCTRSPWAQWHVPLVAGEMPVLPCTAHRGRRQPEVEPGLLGRSANGDSLGEALVYWKQMMCDRRFEDKVCVGPDTELGIAVAVNAAINWCHLSKASSGMSFSI